MIFQLHFVFTLIMVGVIWMVQLVHYPAFNYIDEKEFKNFSLFHQMKITYIVGPVMLGEILTGLYLLPSQGTWFMASMVMLAIVWLSTFFFSVKEHNHLLEGKDSESIRRLVHTNWPRTLLWTVRGVILFTISINV